MKPKTIGLLSLVTLILSVLWLIFFIWSTLESGPMNTFDQVLLYVSNMDWKYVLTYVNASLLTICVTMMFAGLYSFLKSYDLLWTSVGIIFIPVYCTFNLFAYFSQITIVPRLLELQQTPEYDVITAILLSQIIQQWEGSTVAVFNIVGYAILGIPSIIYGVILFKGQRLVRYAGLFLALNGVACIIAAIGMVVRSHILLFGSILGGVLFIIALVLLSIAFLCNKKQIINFSL